MDERHAATQVRKQLGEPKEAPGEIGLQELIERGARVGHWIVDVPAALGIAIIDHGYTPEEAVFGILRHRHAFAINEPTPKLESLEEAMQSQLRMWGMPVPPSWVSNKVRSLESTRPTVPISFAIDGTEFTVAMQRLNDAARFTQEQISLAMHGIKVPR